MLPAIALLAAPVAFLATPAPAATESAVDKSAIDITSLLVFGIGAIALVVTHRLGSWIDRRD